MSSKPKQHSSDQTAPSAAEYAPGSLEARLLTLDAKASKKALHDSRVLKRLGILFIVLGVCVLLLEPLLIVLPKLPGFDGMRDILKIWTILLFPLIVIFPAYGVTLRTQRSDAAKWLIRIVAILGIIGGVLDMIDMVRQSIVFGFIGNLVSVLISVRLLVITYNDILFGKDAPSHNQLGYVRSKWKAGQKPDHIPEHVHKPKRYAKPCFYISFLMIPVALWQVATGIFDQVQYSHAQENYEAGLAAFTAAAEAATPQETIGKYAQAYFNFKLAASDPSNEDVHVYLGLCEARGLGCQKNDGEAFRQLTMHRTATNRFPDAEYELGLLYLYGRGVTQDIAQAAVLLRDAAGKGQRDAMALLGWLEKTEDGETSYVEPDYSGSLEQYLEKKITDEAVRNAGKDEPEESAGLGK
jgi:hypothetical protein